MCDFWINKYEPSNINEIINNKSNIKIINDWLNNFENESKSNLVILGYHGVGKKKIIKLILEKNDYYYKSINFYDDKSKNLFDDIINSYTGNTFDKILKKKKFALLINDIEKITLKNEKKRIKELIKLNKNLFPIIFISNMQHNKLLSDILEYSIEIKINQPSSNDLLIILNNIIEKDNLNIFENKVKDKIIKFCQNDIRRLLSILYDIKNSFSEKEIKLEDIKLYISNSYKKCKDINLFDASKKLIDKYTNINQSLQLYKVDKVLVPLTIHENFIKNLFKKKSDNLNSIKNVTASISKGDVIETNIYTDQNWFLHDIHGFYTCVKTSYNINKNKLKSKKNVNYDMKFSSDLNQTSLKNINKKQITNLQKFFKNKSQKDIIHLNRIIYHLIKDNEIKKVHDIVKNYNNNIKFIENIIKIDKTNPKILISHKTKKLFNSFNKNL